jgi:hypothetical protein
MRVLDLVWGWLLPALFVAPWLVPSIWLWRRRPRDGAVPPSMADTARERLSMR